MDTCLRSTVGLLVCTSYGEANVGYGHYIFVLENGMLASNNWEIDRSRKRYLIFQFQSIAITFVSSEYHSIVFFYFRRRVMTHCCTSIQLHVQLHKAWFLNNPASVTEWTGYRGSNPGAGRLDTRFGRHVETSFILRYLIISKEPLVPSIWCLC